MMDAQTIGHAVAARMEKSPERHRLKVSLTPFGDRSGKPERH
jgi:hypothetical protein